MSKKIFPVRFYTVDYGTWISSPELAKKVWNRIRKDYLSLTWYCADFEVLSPTSIHLYVYDIENSVWGGKGKKIFDMIITELTAEEQAMLDIQVLAIYTEAANDELARQEEHARIAKVLEIRKQMFGV